MTRLRLGALAPLLLLGCASTPSRTLLLRAYLGAADDGGYAWAQVGVDVGLPEQGVVGEEPGTRGVAGKQVPLPPARVAAALARGGAAGESACRTVEDSLAGFTPAGFDPARSRMLVGGEQDAKWQLGEWAGVPAELHLVRASGEVQLKVRLAEAEEEVVAYRLKEAGRTWISGVVLLPGRHRALALTGAASTSSSAVYRMEGLAELDLASALSSLLDARAVRAIEKGALDAARADLERAILLSPTDATAHYNLACALALGERLDEALLTLGRAVELDPQRLMPLAATDPDLAALRERVEFRLMIEPRSPGRVR